MPRGHPWTSSCVRILSGLMAKRGAGPGAFRGVGGSTLLALREAWSRGGCSTESEYVAAANAVVANDSALHKEEADGDDIYYLEETGELVVVSTKGYIRTYFISDLDYFGRQ